MFRRIFDSPWFYFAGAALLLAVAAWTQLEYRVPQRPMGTVDDIPKLRERDDLNVIFMLIDTLRSDRIGSYGYERETTPTIDSLASSGIRFSKVLSQSSWTKTSMASLWTGIYPQKTGVSRYMHVIPESALMPAEIMQEAGIVTAGVWRNGWVAPNFGFSQGFDLYVRPTASPGNAVRNNPSQHPLQGTDFDATKSALEFLGVNAQDRFFLYLHYMDVHQYTYDGQSTIFGTTYSDFYDSALHWTDRNVAAIFDELERQNVLDRTIIVIASDHGEAFYEHGDEGHGKTLHAEVQNVPWLIFLPFRLDKEIVVDTPVANVDIWPTILDLMGLPEMPDAQGRSAVPLIVAAGKGEPAPEWEDRTLYGQLDRNWGQADEEESLPMYSVLNKRYKLIHRTALPNQPQLYDHENDPAETTNLALSEPDKLAELQALLEVYTTDDEVSWGETPRVELDEMRLNQLRALGYALPKK